MPAPKSLRDAISKAAKFGRNGDDRIAHINAEEAALLKARGGSGTINPDTGLEEYWSESKVDNKSGGGAGGSGGATGNKNGGGGKKGGGGKSDMDKLLEKPFAGYDNVSKGLPEPSGKPPSGRDYGFDPKDMQSLGDRAAAEDPTSFSSFIQRAWAALTGGLGVPETPNEVGKAFVSATMPGGMVAAPVGAAMGELAQETIDGIEKGTIPGHVEMDDSMGKVGFNEGEGYSQGNPAADDRAPNSTGLGGGMVGGGGGGAGILGALNKGIGAKLINPTIEPPVVLPSFTSQKPPANISNYGKPGAAIYPNTAPVIK